MKKRKNILFLLLLMVVAVGFVGRSIRAEGSSEPYQIQSYHVDMTVTKQNVCHIEETIQVYFNQSRHGIYRDIPLVNEVSREDGSTGTTRAKVRNVSCHGEKYSTSRSGRNYRLKIGSEDETILGEKVYSISYDYAMGNDILKDADEFYYNIIGTGWDTTIQNVTFSIEMPDSFDESKLGLSYGLQGSVLTEKLRYQLTGNRIEGALDPSVTLQPQEGVTIRLELPEGYFVKRTEIPWSACISIGLAILAMAASFVMWRRYGRDDPVVDVVTFRPPSSFNSLETALAYKGEVDSDDVVSLVVYLAQKGYIEIREGAKSNRFTLIKKKEYDGQNEAERIFMNGLFAKGDSVRKSDLQNSFYKTCNKIVNLANSKRNKRVLFEENSINKHWILYLLTVGMVYAALYQPLSELNASGFDSIFQKIITPLVIGSMFTLGAGMLFRPGRWLQSLPFFFFVAIGMMALGEIFLYMEEIDCFASIFCFAAGFVIMFFDAYMPKRTRYGSEILGRVRGFKNFLETAEKERLEALVDEEPEYFYNILPYAYVLGVSDHWMEQFESIVTEPPHWYTSHDPYASFRMRQFSREMNRTLHAAQSSMMSAPRSSSSSGGGHVGGGSGGGGGGSW